MDTMTPSPGKLLIVESSQPVFATLCEILEDAGYMLDQATTSESIYQKLKAFQPDVLLLNPEFAATGIQESHQLTRQLANNPATSIIPVIFLSSLRDPKIRREAFTCGAADFVNKPFEVFELLQRIERNVRLHRLDLAKRDETARLEAAVAARTQELQKANVELIELNRQIQAVDRAKTSFLNTISHELRTPANGFFGATDLLIAESKESPAEILHILHESRERLMNLIEDATLLVRLRIDEAPQSMPQGVLTTLIQNSILKFGIKQAVTTHFNHSARPLRLNENLFNVALHKILHVAYCLSRVQKLEVHSEEDQQNIYIRVITKQATLTPKVREIFFHDFGVGECDVPNGVVGLSPTIAREATLGMGGILNLKEQKNSDIEFEMLLPIEY